MVGFGGQAHWRRKARRRDAMAKRRRRSGGSMWPLLVIMTALLGGAAWIAGAGPGVGLADQPDVFACRSPYIHDGDNIRCSGMGPGRLYGIDAPELPGACRPGRRCAPGDPIASRDHLRGLVAAGGVRCRQLDTDRYGRAILQCRAGARDLSCAQVDAGHAIQRYRPLRCGRWAARLRAERGCNRRPESLYCMG